MSNKVLLTVCCAVLLAGSAVAQNPPRDNPQARNPERGDRGPGDRPPGDRGGGERGRGGFMRFNPVLAALDADQDGVISAEEIKKSPEALKKLDKNNDGKLTEEEVRPDFGGRGPGSFGGGFAPGGQRPVPEEAVNRFMQNDKNNDGKLSKDELPDRMQGMMERADADKDGFITREELSKMFQSGGGQGFGGDRGGREGPPRDGAPREGGGGRPQRPQFDQ